MSNSSRPIANSGVARFAEKVRDFYLQIDWQSVLVVAFIGLCAIGLFFVVITIGEYRMSR